MQTFAVLLILIIAAVEMWRFWVSIRPNTKVRYFKGRLEATRKMRWDMQFKKRKTIEIREDIRKEWDFMQQRVEAIKVKIADIVKEKGENQKKWTDEDRRVQDDLDLAERDAGRLKHQVTSLDAEVNGAKPTNENPAGTIGINEQIDSLREIEAMLEKWIQEGAKE